MPCADAGRRRSNPLQTRLLWTASVPDPKFATIPRDVSTLFGRRVLRAREFQSGEQVRSALAHCRVGTHFSQVILVGI